MDEARIAEIDADMRKGVVARIEEDQVAGTQQAAFDRAAIARDVGGAALDLDAGRPAIDVADHAAAIEAGFGILAAEAIADIEQAEGVERHFIAFLADRQGLLRYSFRRSGRALRACATGGEQQRQSSGDEQDRKTFQVNVLSKNKLQLTVFTGIFKGMKPLDTDEAIKAGHSCCAIRR